MEKLGRFAMKVTENVISKRQIKVDNKEKDRIATAILTFLLRLTEKHQEEVMKSINNITYFRLEYNYYMNKVIVCDKVHKQFSREYYLK